jgi:septum formation protein
MLILASGSPRRKELLKKITPSFTVIVPDIDERSIDSSVDPKDLPEEESRLKAYTVHALYPNDQVLACDTVVILDGEILGKPHSEEEAVQMLLKQSGKKQIVLSGYTYISPTREVTRSVSTAVYFNKLTEEEIRAYVKKYQPLDKAGAYGIQDEAGLINRIEGSYDNVMGFPSEDIAWHVFARNR